MSLGISAPGAAASERHTRRGMEMLRVLRARPAALIGCGLIACFVLVATFAPWIEPYSPTAHVGSAFAHPSAQHWLGLDDSGADMVSLLLQGSRVPLMVGFAAMAVSVLIGTTVGVGAGYFGGLLDALLMRVADYGFAIPYLPLMIVVAAIWGPSLVHVILVIGLLHWMGTARVLRSQVKVGRERVYVKRARSLGSGHLRIMRRHILPQIGPLLSTMALLSVARGVFAVTALSFLGLADPNGISWGNSLYHAFQAAAVSSGAWWAVVPPGICIVLLVGSCYFLGYSLEEVWNPRLRATHLSVRRFQVRGTPPLGSLRGADTDG